MDGKRDYELDTSDIEQQEDYEGEPEPTPDPHGWDSDEQNEDGDD